jgi:hypothetical protein
MKFQINNHGSLIGFTPVDDTAQSWWDEHVQECPKMGDQYLVEHGYAHVIVEAIEALSLKQQAASDELGAGGPTGGKQG